MNSSNLDRRAYIVDDEQLLRSTIRRTLTGAGIYCQEFDSAESFLEGYSDRPIGCVLLDVRLPGMSGLDLLHRLREVSPPNVIIMISGHAELPLAVSAVKAGAHDFLEKPFRNEHLLAAVAQAFDVVRSVKKSDFNEYNSLTPREKEVMSAFVDGSPNKVVAAKLGLSIRTIEMHRAVIVKKLGAANMMQALLRAKDSGHLR